MSAETLRRAASLMRERAEAATKGVCPAWTAAAVRHIARNCDIDCEYLSCEHTEADDDAGRSGSAAGWDRYDDAQHIASWHPAVALAVADWLDAEAAAGEQIAAFSAVAAPLIREERFSIKGAALVVSQREDGAIGMAADTSEPALAVARAYLGEVDA